jgi:hypothetical protein
MFDCLSTLAHRFWVCVEAPLHGLEQMFMLPSRNPPLWACGALGFERTVLAGCGPVASYPLAIFLIREPIRQAFVSWTAIGVLLRLIDKVLLANLDQPLANELDPTVTRISTKAFRHAARAESGHAAAPPPSRVMTWRRCG